MGLIHYYHIYADGDWREAFDVHFETAERCGLLSELDALRIGVVGRLDRRSEVSQRCSELRFDAEIVATADKGWEQVTLDHLHSTAQLGQMIFYAHSKGAQSKSDLARQWRHSMTYYNVTLWRQRVNDLRTHETSGAYYLHSTMPEHRDHRYFYAGNFWWARGSYIAALDKCRNEHRYQAEGWIGLKSPQAANARAGLATFGNFYQGALTS